MDATDFQSVSMPENPNRCTKKPKTSNLTSAMVNDTEMVADDSQPLPPKLFSKALPQPTSSDMPLAFYMGEDDEEKYDGVDALFNSKSLMDDSTLASGPLLDLSKEKYTSLFKPWRGALILKLLGKTVSLRILEQCNSSL